MFISPVLLPTGDMSVILQMEVLGCWRWLRLSVLLCLHQLQASGGLPVVCAEELYSLQGCEVGCCCCVTCMNLPADWPLD